MLKKDYYKILGVSGTANTSEIKKSYKRLAIKYHPDRNKGNKLYEEKFKEITEAYEVLNNPEKRSMYDRYGADYTNQASAYNNDFHADFTTKDFGDIFGDVFGDIFGTSKAKKSSRGTDIVYEMLLTLKEAVKGTSKNIRFKKISKCMVCNGYGTRTGIPQQLCPTCYGTGILRSSQGFFTVQQTCPKCRGEGYIVNDPCTVCHGHGSIQSFHNLLVQIPAGVDNNDRVKLVGEGNCGKYGLHPGDLYIKIKIKENTIFSREKNNLYCKVPINIVLATLGGVIEVPTLDGKIKLTIPPETQTGKLFRIYNKGVKALNANYYGDLLCKVYIEVPVNLNDYQKKLLYKLGVSLNKNNCVQGTNYPKFFNFVNRMKDFFSDLSN